MTSKRAIITGLILMVCTVVIVAWTPLGKLTLVSEHTAMPITIHWTQDGEQRTKTFTPTNIFSTDVFWLSATKGSTTTIGWQVSETEQGKIQMNPDAGWTIGKHGDINHDGNVNIIDAITVLQIIVGLN